MTEIPKIMSLINQVFSLSYWLTNNTKYKIIVFYNGKESGLAVKIYQSEEDKTAAQIHRVEKINVKAETIIIKELTNIINQLLLIKKDFD